MFALLDFGLALIPSLPSMFQFIPFGTGMFNKYLVNICYMPGA
jgi:hypothetical protein